MATILDTFITRFGFQTDTKGLAPAKKGLADFKSSAIKVAATVGSILAGGFFIKSIAEAADETIKWADANGVLVESLGELEFTARRQGGSNEGLRGSLSNINAAIGEVARGVGRAKIAFEDYGLSVKKSNGETKTADELLIDLNKKFQTLTTAQQLDLGKKLGIDQGTIRLLQTAPDEIARLRKEAARLGVLSRQDAVKAAEFVDGMTNMAQAIQAIKFEIGSLVFEPLSKMFNIIANGIAFFRRHEEIFKTLLSIIAGVGTGYTLMGIKAAIAWVLALGPIILIPALIGLALIAIALLTEEFVAFFKGQDSLLTDYVEKWPELGFAIFAVRDALKTVFKVGEIGFKSWLKSMENTWKAIDFFILGPIKEVIKFLDILDDKFSRLPAFKKLQSLVGVGDRRPSDERQTPETRQSIVGRQPLQGTLPLGGSSPSALFAELVRTRRAEIDKSGLVKKQTTNVRINNLNVDAKGGDSKEIAKNVSEQLQQQLQDTVEDFDSSIRE